jgi:phosphatidylglycerophosphatase A
MDSPQAAVKDFAVRFLASGAFVSYIPARLTGFKKFTGSGLAGTALALLLTPLLPSGRVPFALFALAFLPFSVWIASLAEKSFASHDDPRIVIDEIIGYWTALLFLDLTPASLLAAFVFFRAFDSLKPWPIKKLETSLPGGFGIIMDDVAAGVMANICTRLALPYLHLP